MNNMKMAKKKYNQLIKDSYNKIMNKEVYFAVQPDEDIPLWLQGNLDYYTIVSFYNSIISHY